MPRFYLHVCNGSGFTEDKEGQELPDLDAARRAAVKSLRHITADEMRSGELNLASFIEIEDDAHDMVAIVEFDEAVRVRTERGDRSTG